MWLDAHKFNIPGPDEALAGRDAPLAVEMSHFVNGRSMDHVPAGHERALFGMGCFWGAERKFWKVQRVYTTAVGYAGGHTKNPTYEEVCSGRTGHAEVVQVIYDPKSTTFAQLLAVFWENHDPTQSMRQGNDAGTQYRSAVYHTTPAQRQATEGSLRAFERRLSAHGYGKITTEVASAGPFYFAETYHQQYLAKNPNGYCGLGGTGVACAVDHGA